MIRGHQDKLSLSFVSEHSDSSLPLLCGESFSSATTWRNTPAQGNALGRGDASSSALKGRHNFCEDRELFRPFRALSCLAARNPGRCPGLAYCAPSGQRDAAARRSLQSRQRVLERPGDNGCGSTTLRRTKHSARRGLSLLEVILAIAILGGSLATIGHLVRMGSRSATSAHELNTAQIICQSKMAEITAGAVPPEAVGLTPYEFDPQWQYMVELVPVDTMPGLIAVRVSAQENLPARSEPVAFTLVRWMQDPSLNMEEQNDAYKEAAALAEEEASE
jgi:prepilin-type N-terminal cleavage/methylation domain-containing protein